MKYIVIPLLIVSVLSSRAQVCMEGVVIGNSKYLKKGDTLTFCGSRENPKDKKLYYQLQKSDKLIPAANIRLLFDRIDFWELQQFYYTSYTISNRGWQLEIRKQLEQQTLNYLAKIETEKKIFHDKYAEDYLQRVIQRIHYPQIWKGREQFLSIKILNSDQKLCYAFDNGIILISSQLIADSENEQQLFRYLVEAVGHILLDSNLDNIEEQSSSELRQLGAIYTGYTKKRIKLIADRFINQYMNNPNSIPFNDFEFTNAIAGIISYTAWQEFYSNHYQKALDYLKRLEAYHIENSTDYLLKAKIFMKIADTNEANQEAIKYLRKAASFTDQELPEIYSELGVALVREKQYSEARQYFLKYYELVLKMSDEEKMKWALKMINLCNTHIQTPDKQIENDV